ncbi:hypothetical protein STSP2_02553 [Anaerohalosphaera lusitana]|uniref:Dockerin domain-containing protein n=1 Tax=Anaerohalosphaera lusitana TaxID=1936003 RepID=A0A1U9NNQ3_9BACT|nr:hypothetical protein [Anaerohalosphaera lusitana]AQT69364.1 hypothetical protein STSP2_02553 [Anaerohalosphaera lusitana]
MKNTGNKFWAASLIWVLSLLIFCGFSYAIIWHPESEPTQEWIDRPADKLIGRWGTNGSCVPISPWHVVTTRHQGGSAGSTSIMIDGKQFGIVKIWNHPTADLRIARVDKRLSGYAQVYRKEDENGKNVVVAGYGDGRKDILSTDGYTYGYSWDNSTNSTLRFGTNLIEEITQTPKGAPLPSELVVIRFNDPDATDYECAIADHDSGGGWFIYEEDVWKLAALSRGVEHVGESLFRDAQRPKQWADPDFCHGVRLSQYVSWISGVLGGDLVEVDCDLNGDRLVDYSDWNHLQECWQRIDCDPVNGHCGGGDVDKDGCVDIIDVANFASQWLCETPAVS